MHLDLEAAAGQRAGPQVRVVRGGDRGDDRQPEAEPVPAEPGRLEPAERLEQPLHLVRSYHRAGVGHRKHAAARPDPGRHLHPAAGDVVPHGVVHQVGRQALGEPLIALGWGGAERCVHPHPALGGVGLGGRHRRAGHRRQVERLAPVEAALAARQRQQRLDQPFLLLARCQHPLHGLLHRGDAGVRVTQRDLDQGPLPRERCAQLVRGVRDELPLGREGSLEPGEQPVERLPELGELVIGAVEREPLVQVAR